MQAAVDGVVLLDKPLGMSSHTAVARLRRATGAERAGHVGSLDPLASGMLPVCLGEATKVAGLVATHDKAYRFTLALGTQTSTGDREGEMVAQAPVPSLTDALVDAALQGFRGSSEQVPPMYSAIKQAGQPLYRLARQGRTVDRAPRPIDIGRLELIARRETELDLLVHCSKGTYVRVLGEDIARALGSRGHLASLRRDWVAPFGNLPMWPLSTLSADWAELRHSVLLPTSIAVPALPRVAVPLDEARRLLHGQSVGRPALTAGTCWLLTPDGLGIGLGAVTVDPASGAATIRPQRMFTRPLS